ncbi:hypothetical protein [Bacteroides sp.]|uniref:hypothetical protein n=1 Tax=Bacteroides sp. TaxID=29523 RepID=UPI00262220C7|nr:hypothetical protein [Bacteroides sp.]MDD3040881.1 hypothetical protein [Bacteroides sp.]
MSHTPGPWRVAENLFGNTASYEVYSNAETKSGKGGYTRICQITPRDQKDNAHVIAAAPEMLEALEEMVDMNLCTSKGLVAIRKARGEE